MRRRLWTDEEIRDLLVAVARVQVRSPTLLLANGGNQMAQAVANAYQAGFRAALESVALAVGIQVRGG